MKNKLENELLEINNQIRENENKFEKISLKIELFFTLLDIVPHVGVYRCGNPHFYGWYSDISNKMDDKKNELINFQFLLKKGKVHCKHSISYKNKNFNNLDNQPNYNIFLFSLTSVLNFFESESTQKEIKNILLEIQELISENEFLEENQLKKGEEILENSNDNQILKIKHILPLMGSFDVKQYILDTCKLKNNNGLKLYLKDNIIVQTFFILHSYQFEENNDIKLMYMIRKENLSVKLYKNTVKYSIGAYCNTIKEINEDLEKIILVNNKIAEESFFEKNNFSRFNASFSKEELTSIFKKESIQQNLNDF